MWVSGLNPMTKSANSPTSGGFPPDHVFLQLAYSGRANVIVALLESSNERPIRRVFYRRADAVAYSPLLLGTDACSHESIAIGNDAPILFVNEITVLGQGYDWSRIVAVHLQSEEHITIVSSGNLHRPPDTKRAWIAHLIDASPNGSELICVRGSERDVGVDQSVAIYDLVELNVRLREIKTISQLETAFF